MCKHRKCKADKAIGTWVGSAGEGDTIQYIQFQVLPKGDIVFNSTIDVQQPFPNFPYGAYLTIGQGYWKKIGCNKYATRQTQALVNKDLDPTQNHKGIPLSRLVVDGTFVVSDDQQELDGTFEARLYDFADIHFQNPSPVVNSGTYKMGRLPKL